MQTISNERINLLVNTLADGEFHSGQDLASKLGVSRTAIWKLIAKLQSWHIDIYSVKGKGYKIPDGLSLIDKDKLEQLVSNKLNYFPIIDLLTTVDSTSSFISEQWQINSQIDKAVKSESYKQGRVCISEHQSKGRGRKGNSWVSPFGANLYFSIGIDLPVGLSVLGGLSLAIGIGLTEFINRFTNEEVKLKWPNDLLSDNKKLAGILVEASGDSNDNSFINIGIGINWNMPAKFTQEIDQPWRNLADILSAPIDKTTLMANLLIELDKTVDTFISQGFEMFSKRWEKNSAFIGQEVLISTHKEKVKGVEKGIDKNGAIIVKTKKGVKSFYSGEVSLRANK
ncbi:MAG: bifunctional biotin--[acetyl-CoA-carboxylase] ligase/biotin operon repressor BirA [Kangiellaceae bacterium]